MGIMLNRTVITIIVTDIPHWSKIGLKFNWWSSLQSYSFLLRRCLLKLGHKAVLASIQVHVTFVSSFLLLYIHAFKLRTLMYTEHQFYNEPCFKSHKDSLHCMPCLGGSRGGSSGSVEPPKLNVKTYSKRVVIRLVVYPSRLSSVLRKSIL